jgi:hypothetical protein
MPPRALVDAQTAWAALLHRSAALCASANGNINGNGASDDNDADGSRVTLAPQCCFEAQEIFTWLLAAFAKKCAPNQSASTFVNCISHLLNSLSCVLCADTRRPPWPTLSTGSCCCPWCAIHILTRNV